MTTLIVDDEYLARQRLKNLVSQVPELLLIGNSNTGRNAVKKINNLQPDLVFLDIRLKDMNGFDIIEQLNTTKKPLIIFVSAYDEYALKAFDYFAFDYLLKPFKDNRFFKTINNIVNYFKHDEYIDLESKLNNLIEFVKKDKNINIKNSVSEKLAIKLGNKVNFINTEDIKYIIASGYYAEIYTEKKKHVLRESLTNLSQKLDPDLFVRIHRSTIININSILELIHSSYGEIDIKTLDNKVFRISKSYKKDFQNLMNL
ncbi:MAG: response regulator transcription factor [Flavobacteriaceae bacterium]|nr:response regulator transcription factor [Flavobacteriaceae bacterium]